MHEADRAGWLALRAELPRESWPGFAAFWSLHPGIPDDLRPALGREVWGAEAARVSAGRQAWLEAHRWPRAEEPR